MVVPNFTAGVRSVSRTPACSSSVKTPRLSPLTFGAGRSIPAEHRQRRGRGKRLGSPLPGQEDEEATARREPPRRPLRRGLLRVRPRPTCPLPVGISGSASRWPAPGTIVALFRILARAALHLSSEGLCAIRQQDRCTELCEGAYEAPVRLHEGHGRSVRGLAGSSRNCEDQRETRTVGRFRNRPRQSFYRGSFARDVPSIPQADLSRPDGVDRGGPGDVAVLLHDAHVDRVISIGP